MQKLVKTGKTQKSKNNPMSSFGSIEENIELSHIHLAVCTAVWTNLSNISKKWGSKKDFLKIINLFSVNSVTGCIYTNQVSSNIWNQSIILSLQTIGPIPVIFAMKVLKTDGN